MKIHLNMISHVEYIEMASYYSKLIWSCKTKFFLIIETEFSWFGQIILIRLIVQRGKITIDLINFLKVIRWLHSMLWMRRNVIFISTSFGIKFISINSSWHLETSWRRTWLLLDMPVKSNDVSVQFFILMRS